MEPRIKANTDASPLIRANYALRETIRALREELADEHRHSRFLERQLSDAYDRLHEASLTEAFTFPVSPEQIQLFETLSETFSREAVLRQAKRLSLSGEAATQALEVYLAEEMITVADSSSFKKTGRLPYY